jgi:anti-sigma regulatory factor (Ser/Thr protein kinase)
MHVRHVPNRMAELRSLSEWAVGIARELGCPADRCFDIDLLLTEAVSNVIRHGYTDDGPHEIGIEITREPGALVVRIEDDARPFDPLQVKAPLPATLDEAGPGGRGIVLMRGAADAASYERRDGRNRLTARFAIRDRGGDNTAPVPPHPE